MYTLFYGFGFQSRIISAIGTRVGGGAAAGIGPAGGAGAGAFCISCSSDTTNPPTSGSGVFFVPSLSSNLLINFAT